jgi:hypothetical protein
MHDPEIPVRLILETKEEIQLYRSSWIYGGRV